MINNEWLVVFKEQPNKDNLACIACDRIDGVCCFTNTDAGPFCLECFESLCDPDQALLLEKRLELAEQKIEELLKQ